MRAGALDGLSIGFRTVQGRTDPKSGVRRLDKIDLWEISVVTFPMLPDARVSAVKRRPEREGRALGSDGAQLADTRLAAAQLAAKFRRGARVLRAR